MTDTLRVEHLAVDPPTGNDFLQVGDPVCTTAPDACCGVVSNCLPLGVSALRIERTTYDMPAWAVLIREWCEFGELCCEEPGSGSGSGQCQTCCADVFPYYLYQTDCCASLLPEFMRANVAGDCSGLNGVGYYYNAFQAGFNQPPYGPFNWLWQFGTVGFLMYCDGGTMKVAVFCNNSTVADPPTLIVPLTVSSCCPFAASGSAIMPAGACDQCPGGGEVRIDLFAEAGRRSAGSGSGGSGSCVVLLTKQEWEFPAGTVVSDPFCVDNPDDCCEDQVDVGLFCCPQRRVGRRIFLAVGNIVAPPGCAGQFPSSLTIPLDFSGGHTWIGYWDIATIQQGGQTCVICSYQITASCLIDALDPTREIWTLHFLALSYAVTPYCPGGNRGSYNAAVDGDLNSNNTGALPCDSGVLYVAYRNVTIRNAEGFSLFGCNCTFPITFDAVLVE